MNEIELSLKIATEALRGHVDAQGVPRILEAIAVGMQGKTDEERCAGFLHNVVRHTTWTLERLREEGVPSGVVNAVALLTPAEGESEEECVRRIIGSQNPIALQVERHILQAAGDEQGLLARIERAIEECSHVGLYCVRDVQRTAIFAGGCFWGVQHVFQKEEGVVRTLVGYTGGEEQHPTYAQVRDHETHHVEAVIVEFDPTVINYTRLCQIFFEIHDPAQVNGVGPDIGPQYRSEIFYLSDAQRSEAEAVIADLRSRGYEVNTLLRPAEPFWVGEEYHQRYYEKTGGEPYCHIRQRKF